MAGSLTIPVAEASGQTAPLGGPPTRPLEDPRLALDVRPPAL
jgi:hypothetical protein